MSEININAIKKLVENMPIPYAKMSGMYLDAIEERHARMVLPLGELHKNHVGTAYAGSMFVLAEVYTAVLIYAAYGMDKYIPIASKAEIEYVKPTKADLVIDVALSEEEAAEMIRPIEERGRGRVTLNLPVRDVDGNDVAKVTAVVYLLPATETLMK